MLEEFCIKNTDTLLTAMDQINVGKMRCVFVLNEDGKVIGVLSQGDIMQAILNGVSQYAQVEGNATENFLFLSNRDMDLAVKIFKKTNLSLLPILDENFILKGVITANDIFEYLSKKREI